MKKNPLPPVLGEERQMIDAVAKQMTPQVQEWMSAAATEEWLRSALRDYLRQGLIAELDVIKLADGGDPIADGALRRHIAELNNAGIDPGETLSAYGVKSMLRPPVERGEGHFWTENWRRDIAISCLVFLVEQHFGLKTTRNRKQRRRGEPSASSVVSGVMGRIHVNVSDKTVENIHSGVQGKVAAFIRSRVPK